MSTATLSIVRPLTVAQNIASRVSPTWLVGLTALIVGAAFFAAGHDVNISLAEGYSQSADEMEIASAGGNVLRRTALVVLGAWGCVLLALGRARLKLDPLLIGTITAFLALAAASFAWSDDPGMCGRRLIALLCCAAAAAGVARAFSLRQICWLAVFTLGGLAAVGIVVEVLLGTFCPWTAGYRFAGTVHPNTQGASLATASFATLALMGTSSRSRPWLWIAVAGFLMLLVLTKSRAACAATLLALTIVQFLRIPRWGKLAIAIAGAPICGLALWLLCVFGIDPINDFRELLLLGRAEDADTFTGRSLIWPEVLAFAKERPWLGYGYESFWTAGRIDQISDAVGWGLREAHNAYFEILLWLGIVGLATVVLIAISGLAASMRTWRVTGDSAYLLPIGLIIFALANACFESGIVVVNAVPFILGCTLLRMALFREAGGPKDA
jgi:O-antigen ligase